VEESDTIFILQRRQEGYGSVSLHRREGKKVPQQKPLLSPNEAFAALGCGIVAQKSEPAAHDIYDTALLPRPNPGTLNVKAIQKDR